MAMIEMKNVSKWYGSFQVLKSCSTRVDRGEVVVVCGPSGSGKSTLIKCVTALERFQQGEVIIELAKTVVGVVPSVLPTMMSATVPSTLALLVCSRFSPSSLAA